MFDLVCKVTKYFCIFARLFYGFCMDYSEAIQTLYNQAPMFSHIGKAGYKEGLENTIYIDKYYHEPHRSFHTIHVAGTNGKGSTSHLIAASLQKSGLRVGLYTSPHIVDFSERIKVNGENISHDYVARFIEEAQPLIQEVQPSFFEITTSLAFCYFRDMRVDVAVVEVGLGGRLDCTNVINPLVSVITNISLEHTDLLGDTVEKIAWQKAGIIKECVPVVVGERDESYYHVFEDEAKLKNTSIVERYEGCVPRSELKGEHQRRNERTAWMALNVVRDRFGVSDEDIRYGYEHVCEMTGLIGRWQVVREQCPRIILDVGHNEGCLKVDVEELKHEQYVDLKIVFGVVSDKDYRKMLAVMPCEAEYYYVEANIPRALNAETLAEVGNELGRAGKTYGKVANGLRTAISEASDNDLVLVCGSFYVVADAINSGILRYTE